MVFAPLLAVTLLTVSPAVASPPSATLPEILGKLTSACRQSAGIFDTYFEIKSGHDILKEILTDLQGQQKSSDQDCPEGWSRSGDICFLIPPRKTTWYRAQHHCSALDHRARLASLHPSSLPYVKDLVAATDAEGVWIGLVMLESGGWVWNDGSRAVLFAHDWSPGSPSQDSICGNFFGPGDSAGRKLLNNRPCDTVLNFLCQIKLK